MLTPHSPAFAAALDAVTALLGPASRVMRVNGASLAEWTRGDAAVTLDDAEEHVVLAAIGGAGDARPSVVADDASDAEAAVRAACAWLGWPLPRPTLPGLAPRPVDRDGAPRSTTGGPMGEEDW